MKTRTPETEAAAKDICRKCTYYETCPNRKVQRFARAQHCLQCYRFKKAPVL